MNIPHTTLVRMIVMIAEKSPPQEFRGYFCAGIISNVVGNLPDEYWAEFCKVGPCGEPGCDCHLLAGQLVTVLDAIRNSHKKAIGTRENPFG